MRKTLISLIGILLVSLSLSSNLYAANITTTVCPGVGCVNSNTSGSGSIAIQITGTWVGTITFQSTVDNTNYTSFRVVSIADTTATGVTTTTANGIFNGTVTGVSQVRVVFTAWTSGTAVVSFRAVNQAARFNGGSGGGGGTPGGSNTQIQFNDSGAFGGSANLTWDGTTQSFTSGHGLTFNGVANPITMTGGNDGYGDTAIILDNATDNFVSLYSNQYLEIFVNDSMDIAVPANKTIQFAGATSQLQIRDDINRLSWNFDAFKISGDGTVINGAAEPDLSCCDGSATNGYSSVANVKIQENKVTAGTPGYYQLSTYASDGTVTSPTNLSANAGLAYHDVWGYVGGSYKQLGDFSWKMGADSTEVRTYWEVYNSVYSSALIDLSTAGNILLNSTIPGPSGASLTPVLAGAGAGNVDNGTHSYKFTLSDSDGHETLPGAATPVVTVVDKTANGKVTVNVPYVCDINTMPNVNIYRTVAGNTGNYKLAYAGAYDCYVQWEDDVADADLGVDAPTVDTSMQTVLSMIGGQLHGMYSSDFGGEAIQLGNGTKNFRFEIPENRGASGKILSLTSGSSIGSFGGPMQIGSGIALGTNGDLLSYGSNIYLGGGSETGNGGSVTIYGGNSESFNGNGGSITLTAGLKNGSGANGVIQFYANNGMVAEISDTAVKLDSLKTTGSAGSKKVVCVDTATGQLYASSTGTDCSN